MMKKILFAALALAMGITFGGTSAQAAYPEKPIKIVVPRSAGGSADLVARMFGASLQKHIGANVVVENIAGGSGKIGLSQVFRANPDGYTLVVVNMPSYILTQHLEGGVDYKISDFEPIVGVAGNEANVLIVNAKSLFNSMEELIAYDKANPGKLNLGTTSGLSNSSLGLAMFMQRTGVNPQIIPFADGPAVVTAAMGGHVDLGICSAVASYQAEKDGLIKVFTTFGMAKDPNLPNTPLFADLYEPTDRYDVSMGIVGTPGIPEDVLKVLREASDKAVQDPEFVKTVGHAFGVVYQSADQLRETIAAYYKLADDSRDLLMPKGN